MEALWFPMRSCVGFDPGWGARGTAITAEERLSRPRTAAGTKITQSQVYRETGSPFWSAYYYNSSCCISRSAAILLMISYKGKILDPLIKEWRPAMFCH